MPQPHRTVINFATNLHRRSRKLSLLSSSLFPSDQLKLRSYQTHPRSLIYNPISSPSPTLDPPTDLAAIRPTCWSRCCQTHPPISPSSDPITDLSLPLPLSRSVLIFYYWFGLYIQIFHYNICLEAEKMWENVFSREFWDTQPNTLKYFPKYFL